MKKTCFFFLLIFCQSLFSQQYKDVDFIVKRYPNSFTSIKSFARKINSTFTRDRDKVRAAYYWISNHIYYDYRRAKSPYGKKIHYKNKADLQRKHRLISEIVLRRKTAVCEGYSQLLKFVLAELQIKCAVIQGYVKNDYTEIGNIQQHNNHAWNAVFIDNQWKLIDVTWSTGNREHLPKKFDFDDSYFFISPEIMKWSHFPKDRRWQLTKNPISKVDFFNAPIVYNGYAGSGLALSSMNGIIRTRNGIKIMFDHIDKNTKYYYNIKAKNSKYATLLTFEKKGEQYFVNIPYELGVKTKLVIFGKNKPCLAFKII